MRAITVLVLGCGRVGAYVAADAAAAGHTVAVIDRDAASFSRLPDSFSGRTLVGDGMNRTALEAAGISDCDAVAAVMFGDNSNIVAARTAKETYAVSSVVARIKDSRRAEVYQRLGIPTVAPVPWAADQMLRRLYKDDAPIDWSHPSGEVHLVEHELPPSWAGHVLDPLASQSAYRLVMITRAGRPNLAAPGITGQEGDVLHLLVNHDAQAVLAEALQEGPRT